MSKMVQVIDLEQNKEIVKIIYEINAFNCLVKIISSFPKENILITYEGDLFSFIEGVSRQKGYFLAKFPYTDEYYKDGVRHREDGPADINYKQDSLQIAERVTSTVRYYLEGEHLKFEDWFDLISKENRIKFLFSFQNYKRYS